MTISRKAAAASTKDSAGAKLVEWATSENKSIRLRDTDARVKLGKILLNEKQELGAAISKLKEVTYYTVVILQLLCGISAR